MLSTGDRFGDYMVVRLLGKGGMGAVYLLQATDDRQVAAKILDAASDDHESRKRFLREAQLALGVKHPNLVEVYDVGEDPDTGLCYILMEFVPGGSLADYLKANGALPIEDAVAVVEAMAQVLELARQKGIVHRDVKPGNIMFDAEGTPKLADLGIARGGLAGTETTTVTQTGMMIGTPAYMAPEQMIDAHAVDTRADIYSLGVVFFEMLTGERPNKNDTVVQLMAKAVKGEPLPDVRTLRPEVSASLAQLLAMMVAPDKDGRISTPGQITSALAIIERGGEFVGEAVGEGAARRRTHVGEASSPRQKERPAKSFPWKALVPVGLLAGLAAAFVLLAPKKDVRSQVANPVERAVVKTVVRTNVVERVIAVKPDEKLAGGSAVGELQSWQPGPSAKWFVNWDDALADAKERKCPILVLNTGSTWCHWCKKLRAEVLDQTAFKSFADANLTLLYLDSPCRNADQRNHNKQVVKALKFGGGVPNVRVFTPQGTFLGTVGGGGLAADAYVEKLRGILSKAGENPLDANGRMLFTEGYAALAAKIAEERAKLPKVAKADFKAKLVGVAVVADDNRSRWNKEADFLPPGTHVEVPFGKTALFKVEYEFPEGYEARVWTRDEWPSDQRRNSSFFGSNPSGLYRGKGVTTGFLSLLGRGKACNLKSLAIRTASEPEFDDETQGWTIGSFPVDIVFKEKPVGKPDDADGRKPSTPSGWLDDLDVAKEKARREGKLILAAFEGSDWCGWCKKMEQDVYAKPDFLPAVSSRFVPVYIDKPRDQTLLRETVREKNPALHGEYDIRGVPCVVILDAEGKELGRVGGYKKGVAELMERINALPNLPREKVVMANGPVDPESLRDPDATRQAQKALDALFPGWKVSQVIQEPNEEVRSGFHRQHRGRANVMLIHPLNMETPAVLGRRVELPKKNPCLVLEVASRAEDTDFQLAVRVDGKDVLPLRLVCTPDALPWERIVVPLSRWKGKKAAVEVVFVANNWFYEHAYLARLEVVEGKGGEKTGPVGIRSENVFPCASVNSAKWKSRQPWLYSLREPPADWRNVGFNDSGWRRTVKPLGYGVVPTAVSIAENAEWTSGRIWLRRTFQYRRTGPVYKAQFDVYFDQDAEVWLNGTLILPLGGWSCWWMPLTARASLVSDQLRDGENVLAVSVKGDGPSFFDCGLTLETVEEKGVGSGTEAGAVKGSVLAAERFADKDSTRRVQKTLDALFPGWKTSENAPKAVHANEEIGYVAKVRGRANVLATLPRSGQDPVRLTRTLVLPEKAKLILGVRKNPTAGGGFAIQVYANGKCRWEGLVNEGRWLDQTIDLSDLSGKEVRLEVRHLTHPDYGNARALWSRIAVE